MLNKNTVFILGAGASYSFGYPLGKQLKKLLLNRVGQCLVAIETQINQQGHSYPRISKTTDITSDALTQASFLVTHREIQPTLIKKFYQDFAKSSKDSIDAFLECRPEFIPLGKTLIAIEILSCEKEGRLFDDSQTNWYKYAFNKIFNTIDSLSSNKVSFITYNYDRSLEYFLVQNILSTYGLDIESAKAKVESINIIHVHGKVGKIPWVDHNIKPYNIVLEAGHINEAIEQLYIISEDISGSPIYDQVHQIMSEAENIFILGFGYHKTNLERLKIPNYKSKQIFSTRQGITNLNVRDINDSTEGCIMFGYESTYDIVDFFENEVSINGNVSELVKKRTVLTL